MNTTIKPRSRQQLHRRATTYEVAIEIDSNQTRLGFSARKTRQTLIRFSQDAKDRILPNIEEGDDLVAYHRDTGLRWGRRVRVFFTGRTERECATLECTSTA